MGIVTEMLVECDFSDGSRFLVELNEGEAIHMHWGRWRVDMSVAEFLRLCKAAAAARDVLVKRKRIDEIQ